MTNIKRFAIIAALATMAAPATVNAQGLFYRLSGGASACAGGVCRYRATSYSYARSAEYTPAPCAQATSAPEPCDPVTADTPAPCDPVTTPAPEPCDPVTTTTPAPEPCAPVTADTPAPCDPVSTCEGCDHFRDAAKMVAGDECVGGACPLRDAVRSTVDNVAAVAALAKINALRARYGLRALVLDATLQSGAEAHCAAQARAGRVYHAAGSGWEICAVNGGAGIDGALAQWVASSGGFGRYGHREILLNASFTRVGVATVRTADGRNYCTCRFN